MAAVEWMGGIALVAVVLIGAIMTVGAFTSSRPRRGARRKNGKAHGQAS